MTPQHTIPDTSIEYGLADRQAAGVSASSERPDHFLPESGALSVMARTG
jgi:hypothetical protein